MNLRVSQLPQLCSALLLAGLPISGAYAQIVTAGDLLVNLNATTFNNGDTTWTNTGTLGTAFDSFGTTPKRTSFDNAPAIFFDGSDVFVGPASPPTIDGVNQTVSIEVWALQGGVRPEETLVAFAKRGGPDGSNMSFNYGYDDRFGAVGHWASPDLGWGPNDPNGNGSVAPGTPAEGRWHLLTYTFDGSTQRVYSDGVLMNSENISLNLHQGLPIQIGAQRDGDGATVTGDLRLSGAIGKVRIHDGVLSDAAVAQNFNTEKGAFNFSASGTYLAKPTAQLSAGPLHRYTFNNLASGASGTVIPDVAGVGSNKADGVVRGAGATVSGTSGLDLPGGSSQTQAYVDLPNGIISGTFNGGAGYANASYETWVTIQSNQNWSRIMDFGSRSDAEVLGPGGDGNGTNYIFVGANVGGTNQLVVDRGGANGSPGVGQRQAGLNNLGSQLHLVLTYDDNEQEWSLFKNGVLSESFFSNGGPTTINDVNNWLGRSQWSGDANLDGIFDEFRIYDYELSQDQVQGNFVNGPNVVNVVPEPASAALLALGAFAAIGTRRRRKA